MNVKEQVLLALEGSRKKYLSGEALAKQLNVSRQAVWKAVNELKADGYKIVSVPHKGHAINGGDILSAVRLHDLTGVECDHFGEVASTNETAKRWLSAQTPHLIVADSQTEGKATDGVFPSPVNGVYFSLVMPFAAPYETFPAYRKAWATVVKEAIAVHCGVVCQVKDDTEFLSDGHKVGGMLCECLINANTAKTSAVIVGVGLYTQENALPLLPVETRNDLIAQIVNQILQ